MQLNSEKIKKSAAVGAKFDLIPLATMAIFLIGLGVTNVIYAFSPFNKILYVVIMSVLCAVVLAALILFCIGSVNRNRVNKCVFNYADEITAGVIDKICVGESVNINIKLSPEPDAAVFTLTCGAVTAEYDLTPVLNLNSAASTFVAACIGGIGARIKSDIAGGKVYKDVAYSISVSGEAEAKQSLVKNGAPDEKELDQTEKIYKKYSKKYKK